MTTQKQASNNSKRRAILDCLMDYQRDNGYSPSQRDIQEACHFSSTSVVHYHLSALERSGYIIWNRRIARAIRVTSKGRAVRNQPPL